MVCFTLPVECFRFALTGCEVFKLKLFDAERHLHDDVI